MSDDDEDIAPRRNLGGHPVTRHYLTEYAGQAKRLCLRGATDLDLKAFFQVGGGTFNRWQRVYPEFRQAILDGREVADARVAHSLYRRAIGFDHPAVKIFADARSGTSKVVEYTEKYAPDTIACIFWLKNRRPDLWRDRHETYHSVAQVTDEREKAVAAKLIELFADPVAAADPVADPVAATGELAADAPVSGDVVH